MINMYADHTDEYFYIIAVRASVPGHGSVLSGRDPAERYDERRTGRRKGLRRGFSYELRASAARRGRTLPRGRPRIKQTTVRSPSHMRSDWLFRYESVRPASALPVSLPSHGGPGRGLADVIHAGAHLHCIFSGTGQYSPRCGLFRFRRALDTAQCEGRRRSLTPDFRPGGVFLCRDVIGSGMHWSDKA